MAGFGKSHLIRQLPEFSNQKTVRLAFSNVATENLEDDNLEYACHTIHSYFGINCVTGKCSEKKIKNMKNIETVMISECFTIPQT